MVLFSADLSIIQDSIIKVGDKISRDFVELENLQNSYKGSTKFAELIIEFIKRRLFEHLKTKKPNYDVVFYDDKNEDKFQSDYRYLINPICGVVNLVHAIPYFCVSIALQKKNKDGIYQTLCGVIDSPITQETFVVEQGKGAYVNSRRIRVSSRSSIDDALTVIKNTQNRDFIIKCLQKYKLLNITNCDILNICNVASGKFDITVLEKNNIFLELPILLLKEAGGLVKTGENQEVILCNDLLESQI